MKAVVYSGHRSFAIVERQLPILEPDCATVRVLRCGITDAELNTYLGNNPLVAVNRIPGHQICGIVTDVHDYGRRELIDRAVVVDPIVSCGKCARCIEGLTNRCENMEIIGTHRDGGYAEYICVPVRSLHVLPNKGSCENFSLACCLATAIHVVSRVDWSRARSIGIWGADTIGILVGTLLSSRGGLRFSIIDANPYRLNIARSFGLPIWEISSCDWDTTAIQTLCDGEDCPDTVIGNFGSPQQIGLAARMVVRGGQIIVLGGSCREVGDSLSPTVEKELTVTGCSFYTGQEFRQSLETITAGKFEYRTLVTHRLPIEGIMEGIHILEEVTERMHLLVSM
jgi:threonine dehydrogenase-like Zn-dependent dehydrogenase